jgi:hypothetical protein
VSRTRNPYRRGSFWYGNQPAQRVEPDQLDEQPAAEKSEPAPARPNELRHGYTLEDLHQLARLAVHTAGAAATDWHERHDTAWSAIAEEIYGADVPPARHDLIRAGQLAIYRVVSDHQQAHGYYKRKTIGAQAGPASSPNFLAYWWDLSGAQPTQSPEGRIVERYALAAILPQLTAGQRDTVLALAIHDDYQSAAAALGLTSAAFNSQISKARRRFLALWHEGERPSTVWGCDRRAGTRAGSRRVGGTAIDAVRRKARAKKVTA